MSATDAVRMAMTRKKLRQSDLAEAWGVRRQTVNAHVVRDSWTAKDLMSIAEMTGGHLAFVYPDGQQIVFFDDGGAESRRQKQAPAEPGDPEPDL